MTDTTNKVLEHYSAVGLTGRIQSALAAIAPESQTLTVAQLAPLDQFHLFEARIPKIPRTPSLGKGVRVSQVANRGALGSS